MFRTQGTMLSLDSFRHTIDNYWISLLLVWNSAYWSKTLLFNKSLSKKFDDQKSSGISVPIANACCFIVYHIHLLFWYFCMNSVYIIFVLRYHRAGSRIYMAVDQRSFILYFKYRMNYLFDCLFVYTNKKLNS